VPDIDADEMTSAQDMLERVRLAWAEVLNADDVPLDTNFLEAGGNSLLLVMLWELLQDLTERRLRMSDLFQFGTVRAQAAMLAADGGGAGTVESGEPARPVAPAVGRAVEPARPVESGAPDRRRLLGRAARASRAATTPEAATAAGPDGRG
jgi:acyl carrier protein